MRGNFLKRVKKAGCKNTWGVISQQQKNRREEIYVTECYHPEEEKKKKIRERCLKKSTKGRDRQRGKSGKHRQRPPKKVPARFSAGAKKNIERGWRRNEKKIKKMLDMPKGEGRTLVVGGKNGRPTVGNLKKGNANQKIGRKEKVGAGKKGGVRLENAQKLHVAGLRCRNKKAATQFATGTRTLEKGGEILGGNGPE